MVQYVRSVKGIEMTVKDQLLKAIGQMPDECSAEDLQYQLYVIEKTRKGLKSIDEGCGISHDDVRKRLSTCPPK